MKKYQSGPRLVDMQSRRTQREECLLVAASICGWDADRGKIARRRHLLPEWTWTLRTVRHIRGNGVQQRSPPSRLQLWIRRFRALEPAEPTVTFARLLRKNGKLAEAPAFQKDGRPSDTIFEVFERGNENEVNGCAVSSRCERGDTGSSWSNKHRRCCGGAKCSPMMSAGLSLEVGIVGNHVAFEQVRPAHRLGPEPIAPCPCLPELSRRLSAGSTHSRLGGHDLALKCSSTIKSGVPGGKTCNDFRNSITEERS